VFVKAGLIQISTSRYFINCKNRDLASAHYTKDSLVWLEELKIEYVPKKENSPNVPQMRPIENFWANLKMKVYSNNYRPKDVKCLVAKIRKELKTTGIRKAKKNDANVVMRWYKQFFLKSVHICILWFFLMKNTIEETAIQLDGHLKILKSANFFHKMIFKFKNF
jgi:hypothetical protein